MTGSPRIVTGCLAGMTLASFPAQTTADVFCKQDRDVFHLPEAFYGVNPFAVQSLQFEPLTGALFQ